MQSEKNKVSKRWSIANDIARNLKPFNMHYSSKRVFTQATLRQSSQNRNVFIPRVWERVELNYCFECSTMSLWWSPARIDGSVSELCLPFQVYQLWHICSMSVKLKLQKPRERKSCWPELISVCRTIKNSEITSTLYLHPQYHDWGALEQGIEPPTAPRALKQKWLPTAPGVFTLTVCVCVHCCVWALRMG